MQFILMTDGAFMVANDYLHLREAQTGFQSLTSWRGVSDCDLTEENPRRMACAEVERTFLETFGIRPLLGRDFNAEEDRPNGPKVAILSYGFWQRRFGGGMDALGKKISIDDVPTEIVGVLPPTFELPHPRARRSSGAAGSGGDHLHTRSIERRGARVRTHEAGRNVPTSPRLGAPISRRKHPDQPSACALE